MIVPFAFSFTAANQECALWEGRVTSAGAQLNVLAPSKPLEPTNGRKYLLRAFALMTDTIDAPIQIGVWNITDDTWVTRYEIQATQVEAGGIVVPEGGDLLLNCVESTGDTLVPAVRYIGATTARIVGHLDVEEVAMTGAELGQSLQTAFDASMLLILQQEDGWPVEDESGVAIDLES